MQYIRSILGTLAEGIKAKMYRIRAACILVETAAYHNFGTPLPVGHHPETR